MAQWNPQVNELFLKARDFASPDERRVFLDEACGGDADLRAQVEALLKAGEQAGSFLEAPAATFARTIDQPLSEGPGTVIGPYKVLEQLGEGGFGVVYLAEQTEPVRRKVALKILKAGMDTRQVVARFEAERQALAIMDHPNIARVFDGGETPPAYAGGSARPYFVMELVKGLPITQFCDEHKLSPRQRLELFVSVCHAVQHAHHKGIIHRDIKPSNVLVSRHDATPVVKVIDFGIAKALGQDLTEKTVHTGLAQMIGTPLYMSPEQAGMSDLDIDTRSDIYSLGVLLYELLTGTTPFTKERFKKAAYDEIRRIIREEEPPKPSTRLSESKDSLPSISAQRQMEPTKLTKLVRGELDWIVMKALDKDRNRRYATANDFAVDIQRYLKHEPVAAGPPSAWYRFRKFAQRNKGPMLAAGAMVLLLTAGIAGTTTGLVWALEAEEQALTDRDAKEAARQEAVDSGKKKDEARKQAQLALKTMAEVWIEDLLARQPQLTDKHREHLKTMIAQHRAFTAAKADDPEGYLNQAEAFLRVGRIHWFLGEIKEAESAYRDALLLEKQIPEDFRRGPEFRKVLGNIQTNLGLVLRDTGRLKEAEAVSTAALARRKEFVKDFPDRLDGRVDVGRAYLNLGVILHETGRSPQAEKAYGDALAELQAVPDKSLRRGIVRETLGWVKNNLGNLLAKKGREKDAEAAYAAAQAHFQQLADDFRDYPDARRLLAISYHNLACREFDSGRLKEAEDAYHKALDLLNSVVTDMPARLDFRNDLARSQIGLGQLLKRMGRLKDAEDAFRPGIDQLKRLTTGTSTRLEFRLALADTHLTLGKMLRSAGRLSEAEDAFGKAHEVLKELKVDYPALNVVRQELGSCHLSLGNLLHEIGRLSLAEEAFLRALSESTELIKEFPENAEFRYQLAFAKNNFGNFLRDTGRHKDAERYHREALLLRQNLLDEFPQRIDLQDDLAFTWHGLGNVLQDLGRSPEAEKAFAEALALRKKLAERFPGRPDFLENLALTHDCRGNTRRTTGRVKEAEVDYQTAIALGGQLTGAFPGHPDFREKLAVSHTNLGHLRRDLGRAAKKNAETEFRAALALLKPLVEEFPNRPGFRHNLARSYLGLGLVLGAPDELPEEESACREAVKLLQQLVKEQSARPGYRQDLALSHASLGVILENRKQPKDAELHYRNALAIQNKLVEEFGDRIDYRADLARSHFLLGLFQDETGRAKDAEQSIRKAIAIQEGLAVDPGRPAFRAELARSLDLLGRLLAKSRGPGEAELTNRKVLNLRKELVEKFPNRPEYRIELAEHYFTLGSRAYDARRMKEAENAYRLALPLQTDLEAEFPDRRELRHKLARTHLNLGNVLYVTGQGPKAESEYRKALPLHAKLVDDFPEVAEYRNYLAGTLVNLGMIQRDRKEYAAAVAFLDQAQPHHEAALKAEPRNDMYLQFQQNNLWTRVECFVKLADHAKAADTADKLARCGCNPVLEFHLAACYLGRCVELAGKDTNLAEDKRKQLAEGYGTRAVVFLRQAFVKGYKSADRWGTLPDLAALRPRDDFQKLLKDVAERPDPGDAAPLEVGKALPGVLTRDHPIDSFVKTKKSHYQIHKILLDAGQPYVIDLQGKFDTFLRVENAQRLPLQFNDDVRPDDPNSRLVFVPPQAGTYRLVVTSFKPAALGVYTLNAQKAEGEGAPTVIKDQLQKTDKKHLDRFFRTHELQLKGGSPYAIELESQAFAPYLVLLDDKGKPLASNDQIVPGNKRKSRIDFTPRADARFTLVATTSPPQETGAYTLTVQRYAAPKAR